MEQNTPIVFGKAGLRGRLLSDTSSASLSENDSKHDTVIELEDGRQLHVPAAMLVRQPDGGYYLPLSLTDVEKANKRSEIQSSESVRGFPTEHSPRQQADTVVPVVQEELSVAKRVVETGKLRITKRVHEHEEIVDEALLREEVSVAHVPIGKIWEGPPPPPRYEGETYVLSLLEEVLVVEKRLMLKEELHISRVTKTVHEPQTIVLRSEEVSVERVGPEAAAPTKDTVQL